jgi:hypothetical protein
MVIGNEVMFDETREIEEALAALRSTYSEPDYEPASPNHADELTDEAFTAAADALIGPFSNALERCYAARRKN